MACRVMLMLIMIGVVTEAKGQLKVIKNLENQNVGDCQYDSASNTVTFAPYIDSLNTCAVWFNFGVTGYRRDTLLTFKSEFERVVHRANMPAISSDNVNFRLMRQSESSNSFRVSLMPDGDTTYIATGYPYTLSRLRRLIDYYDGNSRMSAQPLITTDNGIDVPIITITHPNNRRKKNLVWIICRQHAFESVGSFVTEGMIRCLMSDSCSKKMLKKHIFKIVPMVDVADVQNGQTGRMSKPVDFNRDWDNPVRPTIRRIEEEIDGSASRYRYTVFMDVHGTFPGGSMSNNFSYFDLRQSSVGKDDRIKDYWLRFEKLSGFLPYGIRDYYNKYDGMTADWWNEINYGGVLQFSTTIETDWCTNSHNNTYSIDDYLEIGRWMIMSLY